MDIENYKIIAAIFGVIGSVILAYRNKKIQSAQTLVASAQDHNTRQMMRNSGDIVIFGELDKMTSLVETNMNMMMSELTTDIEIIHANI